MEVEASLTHIPVSDLLHRCRPLTGASSFSLCRSIHRHTPHKNNPHLSEEPKSPSSFKILKPLGYPTLLIGTLNLTLPSFSCSNPSCLKFSDDSAAVCCDIIDLDLCVIGRRIRVDAWNFLPVKPHGGYLEIIRWSLDQTENISNPIFNGFYLHSVFPSYEESLVPRHLIYGLLNSVSPVTNVPCTANKTGTRNLNGFLAEIFVCECKLCCSKDRIMLLDVRTREQNTTHNFSKSKILYFCGSASVWYPSISRMVEGVVMISGMKKKMVFLGEEGKSLMMYVTTEKAILHLPMSTRKQAMNGRNTATRGKGLSDSHTGSITGVYMHGMVIELDQKVLLLIDHQLSMPHSLRIGAIVTVRNFHLEDPKFSWTKVQIFGSCYKTSIRVNMFSPIESGCYQATQSKSVLRKYIESLTFSSRLWVLLVVSSMRKKFAGVLSEMEILGSKHTEGLVQKYSSSCLPLSVFRFRHGVLTEYCLHDLCECGKEIDFNPSKLVVPISNLISQCEDTFIKSLHSSRTHSAMNHNYSNFVCGGKSHDQPIRKIFKSEDMNVVLLGTLKISKNTGRLQLIDATGSIDVIIPDLPSVWSVKDIYEINDFIVVMEGFPQQLEHLESLNNEPFSCSNIFNHFQLAGRKRLPIYIWCLMRDAKSRNYSVCPSIDKEEHFKDLETRSFHLLRLVHKFPVQQKIPGRDVIADSLSVYAEAVLLSWNIVLHKRERYLVESYSDGRHSHSEKHCGLSCLQEFPCTIDFQTVSVKSMVKVGNMKEDSSCNTARKLLLEFNSGSFWKYELLRIGGYYMIKHHEKDLVCTATDKVFVDPKTHLWSVSFSTNDKEVQSVDSHLIHVLRSIDGCPEICPDIYLQPLADHSNFLEIKLKELKEDLIQPTNSIKGLSTSSWSHQTMMGASMLSGVYGSKLPEGNLLTVQGHVVAVHKSDQGHFVTRLHHIVPGVRNVFCIHVIVGDNMVKIYSSLSVHIYPIGFGPGVRATFHRLLLTCDANMLKLTSASFIEVNSIVIDEDPCSNEQDDVSVKPLVETVSSLPTGPAALISEMMKFSDHTQMRLNCRLVSIFVLVLEKNNEFLQPFSTINSEIARVKFPLAGFIMDDGSSSCCCWTDNERVMTLLGLHEHLQHAHFKRSLHKSNKMEMDNSCGCTMSRMSKILDRHGTIVMKNHGSVSDCLCPDGAISVSSESVVSESDEQVLKSLVLQASSGNTWNVVGSVLDSNGVSQLEEWLQRLDMVMLPMKNIWASEVYHMNILNEGRSILQELLNSK